MSPEQVLERAQDDMRERQYTIVTEDELGFPGMRFRVLAEIYRPAVLIPAADAGGPVRDRWRAKDFLHYRWAGSTCSLTETSADRYARLGHPGRVVPRLHWLSVPGGLEMAAVQLSLIPPEWRHEAGTWGVHAFRSFSNVVDQRHQDGFEFGITWVLDRVGDGAVSYLFDLDDNQVLDHQLQPGEILLFKDAAFTHGATALEGTTAKRRDALVIQFDAPEDLIAAQEEQRDLQAGAA
jgi:2OG-Fe dioxygenase